MLLALGLKAFNTNPWDPLDLELIQGFAFNISLKSDSIMDELQDNLIKELPNILKQSRE